MGTFILKEKVRKKGIKETPLDQTILRVGRALENDIVIDDPLVSPNHCELEWIGGVCRLSNVGSVSGTYVNGAPIDEYFTLEDGQTVSLGMNQIKIDVDRTAETCGIMVELNVGTGEKQLHREIHITVRAWYMNPKWYALAGAVLFFLPVLALTAFGMRTIYMNGDLASPHATSEAVAPGGNIDCAACHQPLKGVTVQKCDACHQEVSGEKATHKLSDPKIEALGCVGCHTDHQGLDFRLIPRDVSPAECRKCHEDAHTGTGDSEDGGPGAKGAGGSRMVSVGFDAFSHLDHSKAGVERCDKCHQPNNDAGRDFSQVGYDACVACHDKQTRDIANHGSNSECLTCHQSAEDFAQLKVVTDTPISTPPLAFGVQHHARDRRCQDCHTMGLVDLPSASQGLDFDHFYHLSSLLPEGRDAKGAAAEQCANCHSAIGNAISAAESLTTPDVSNCTTCHTDVAKAGEPTQAREARQVVEFSHKDHVGKGRLGQPGVAADDADLSAGANRLNQDSCFACHPFASDEVGVGVPAVKAAAADCASCHYKKDTGEHFDAGLKSCDYCHFGNNSVYAPAKEVKQERPGEAPYQHHLDTADDEVPHAHATADCAKCHESVFTTSFVSHIRFPKFTDAACQDCHGNMSGQLTGGDLQCVKCHGYHVDKAGGGQ